MRGAAIGVCASTSRELIVGGLHQFGVKRAGDLERHDLHGTQLGGDRLDSFEGDSVSGDDDIAGAEQVGLPKAAKGCDAAAQLVDGRLVEAQDAGHAAGCGHGRCLHGLAPFADDLQARLEVDRTGKNERSVFAQAQPGGAVTIGDDFGLADLEAFERRQAGDEDRRLTDIG